MNRTPLSRLVLLLAIGFPVTGAAVENFAVEVLAGRAKHEASLGLFQPIVDEDDTSLGIRGTWQLSKHWGFDLSYNDFGEANDTTRDSAGDAIEFSLKGSAVELNLNGRMFLVDRLALIGRMGVSRYDSEISIGTFSDDDDGYSLVLGAGIQYGFTDHFFSSVDYSWRDLSGGSLDALDFDSYDLINLTVSLGYRF